MNSGRGSHVDWSISEYVKSLGVCWGKYLNSLEDSAPTHQKKKKKNPTNSRPTRLNKIRISCLRKHCKDRFAPGNLMPFWVSAFARRWLFLLQGGRCACSNGHKCIIYLLGQLCGSIWTVCCLYIMCKLWTVKLWALFLSNGWMLMFKPPCKAIYSLCLAPSSVLGREAIITFWWEARMPLMVWE